MITTRPLINRRAFWNLIGFTPTQCQVAPANSNAQIRVFCAGRRTGKTLLWSIEDARILLSGPYRVWIVGPSHELVERCWRVIQSVLWNSPNRAVREYCKPTRITQGAPRRASFKWGAELVCLSAQDPDASLLGEGVDHLHITEAARLKEIVFQQYLLPVTVDRRAHIILDSTPRGKGWFKRLFDKGQKKGTAVSAASMIESWKAPSWANTISFPKGELDPAIERMRSEMSPLTFQQEVEASFVTFEGRLVPEFDVSIHGYSGKDPFIPPVIYAGFDWGYNHPAALVVGGVVGGRAIVLDEFITTEQRPTEIIAVAKQLSKKWNIRCFFCSPERPEIVAEFNNSGLTASKANNERTMGIDTLAVYMKLIRNQFFPTESVKNFYISVDRCPKTIEAFETAHYKKIKDITSDDFDDDHLDPVDAARYLFHSMKKQFDPEKIGSLNWINQ